VSRNLTSNNSDRQVMVHSLLAASASNGPGERSVIWFQGCSLKCSGCWNPETHGALDVPGSKVTDVLEQLLCFDTDGVTFTGGEPFDQPDACLELASRLHQSGKSVIAFSGYSKRELNARFTNAQLSNFDTILAGRFRQNFVPTSETPIYRDKELWNISGRYSEKDFLDLPPVEFVVSDSELIITGLGVPSSLSRYGYTR